MMFSRTPVAKQFRRWVLDVLDKLEEEERTKTELVKNLDRLPFLFPSHRSELKGIVNAKISTYPASVQGKARPEIWTRFNRHFRIAEYSQLPTERMAEARDYPFRLYREGDESLCLKRLLAKPVKAPIIKIGAEDATNILRPFFKESLFPVHQAPVSVALSTVTRSAPSAPVHAGRGSAPAPAAASQRLHCFFPVRQRSGEPHQFPPSTSRG